MALVNTLLGFESLIPYAHPYIRAATSGEAAPTRTRLKRALKGDIDEAAWATLYDTKSRPFPRPTSSKIAVKVINHYGDEVLKVYEV